MLLRGAVLCAFLLLTGTGCATAEPDLVGLESLGESARPSEISPSIPVAAPSAVNVPAVQPTVPVAKSTVPAAAPARSAVYRSELEIFRNFTGRAFTDLSEQEKSDVCAALVGAQKPEFFLPDGTDFVTRRFISEYRGRCQDRQTALYIE